MLPYPRMFKEKDFLVEGENFWYDASETTSLASHDASKIQKPSFAGVIMTPAAEISMTCLQKNFDQNFLGSHRSGMET